MGEIKVGLMRCLMENKVTYFASHAFLFYFLCFILFYFFLTSYFPNINQIKVETAEFSIRAKKKKRKKIRDACLFQT